jgi:DNA-binding transcriptional regulator LsrR (DeoR family)
MSTDVSRTPRNEARRSAGRRRSSRSSAPGSDELDDTELIGAVCTSFVEGHTVGQIVQDVEQKYGIKLKREKPYALLRLAAKRGWLSFNPPQHWRWTKMLGDDHPWLQSTRVVHAAASRDVTQAGAESLLRLIKNFHRIQGRGTVHVGFCGGHTMRALARAFAGLLSEPTDDLPQRVVIHAMAAGFDPHDPTTDPNTFCSYFTGGLLNDIKVEFLGLAAPSMVQPDSIRRLRTFPGIKEAFEAVGQLDIIVASGSCWLDGHSALRNLMHSSSKSERVLEENGCIGDVFWRPLSDAGPIEIETAVRALTLVDLSDLPGLIRDGKRVLLSLGPCGKCNTPKGRLLACLLQQRQPLMTDLVVDSRTVAQMMRGKGGDGRALTHATSRP